MKHQAGCEVQAPAGDLSDEADEVQLCEVQALGEEKGYEADSESNPEDSVLLEEGITIHMYAHIHTQSFHYCAHTQTYISWKICTIKIVFTSF